MAMNFDPMTGQPIQQEGPKFDPMTGQPIQQNGPKFDPMTGQPIQQNGPKFDPMTGKPIQQNGPKFDPITGQPVYNNGGYQAPPKKKSSKAVPWIIAGVAGLAMVALAGGIGIWAATGGLLLSGPNKVALAVYNTVSEGNQLLKDLTESSLLKEDSVTVETNVSVEGVDVEVIAASSKKQKQVRADVSAGGFMSVEAIASLDDEYLKFQLPTFADDVIAYNYTEEKDGFLTENVDYEVLDMLDEALAAAYNGKAEGESEEFTNALIDTIKDQYAALEFEKVRKEKFEVNGKDVKCNGYAVTITEDVVVDMIDEVADVFYDYYADEIDPLLETEGTTWYDMIDEMVYELEGMPEFDVTVYLYKNKLAAVILEEKEYDEEVQILFLGGDYRMQNMEFVVDGETVVEIEGETDGSEEYLVVSSYGTDVLEYTYDSKDGAYSLNAADVFYVEGMVEVSNKEFRLDIDELIVEGTDVGTASIYAYKGADFVEMDGDLLDIGNASEAELEEFAMKYSDLLDMAY